MHWSFPACTVMSAASPRADDPGQDGDPGQDAATAEREHLALLDAVITGIFHAGLSLQTAIGLPAETAGQRIEAALGDLDDIIREIRGTAFAPPAAGRGADRGPAAITRLSRDREEPCGQGPATR
jgi:hypothetical protein